MRTKTVNKKQNIGISVLIMLLIGFAIIWAAENLAPKTGSISLLTSGAGISAEEEVPENEEEEEDSVRTTQYNIFCTPIDTSGTTFMLSYDRDDYLNRLRCSYHTIPAPRTQAKFETIENVAKSCLGIRYTPAGKSPSTGFDCSGFVYYVMNQCRVKIKSGSCEGQLAECYIVNSDEVRPGDIVFFMGTQNRSTVSHVGIYLGDGQMIHAGTGGICIVNLSQSYWVNHFYCYGRPYK